MQQFSTSHAGTGELKELSVSADVLTMAVGTARRRKGRAMSDLHAGSRGHAAGENRSDRLDRAIHGLLAQTPEIEAAAVVSFDGLPMASALPQSMDEDRVAAMSAALLSLGERAAQGLGRGELSQVYIEGDAGTVFLVSADDEAVLVAVAAKGAKVGMMLYEVRRTAAAVAEALRADDVVETPAVATPPVEAAPEPLLTAVPALPVEPATYAAQAEAPAWTSYAPSGSVLPGENPTWS
jgi:predicted regulator of Ras-like GTPase activity (Roadblock/LC7/MglB family)